MLIYFKIIFISFILILIDLASILQKYIIFRLTEGS